MPGLREPEYVRPGREMTFLLPHLSVVCAGGGTSWLAFDFLLSYHLPLCLRLRVCCFRLYHALQAAGIDLGLVAITTAVAAGGRTGKASQRSPLAGVLTPLAEATILAADERSTPT